MTESLVTSLMAFFSGKVSKELVVFFISLLPILELRGGILAAFLLNIPWFEAYIICVIANIIPVPFILLFIRPIFNWLKKTKHIAKYIHKLEERAFKKSDQIKKYEMWGLFLFVAVPLPGTGAWTGSLIAALLNMRMKYVLPVVFAGVLVAGFIMTALSYGLLSAIGIG